MAKQGMKRIDRTHTKPRNETIYKSPDKVGTLFTFCEVFILTFNSCCSRIVKALRQKKNKREVGF